jgi:hypothetical protein
MVKLLIVNIFKAEMFEQDNLLQPADDSQYSTEKIK